MISDEHGMMEINQNTALMIEDGKAQLELKRPPDPNARRLFWSLFAGSRGGNTRLRIIASLMDRPYNRNQLAKVMGLDYKAIQHHLDVLEKNNLITKQDEQTHYSILFFISPYFEAKMDAFDEIWNKIGKK
ncbi:MAG: ArsR/SmtB family transcription factor [Nitrososphaerales archaeon]